MKPSMKFDVVTIFPDFFAGPLDYGIVRRAREAKLIDVAVHDLRTFTHDRHRTVDDRPFGGGEGMVLKPEPLFEAVESLLGREAPEDSGTEDEAAGQGIHVVGAHHAAHPQSHGLSDLAPGTNSAGVPMAPADTAIVLLSASGKLFRQETARRFAQLKRVIFLCGRYEGVDERVAEHLATDELSIGDFVLSGGELAAALILDAVTRLLPGALGNEDSSLNESFSELQFTGPGPIAGDEEVRGAGRALLDFPHYTRPADFRGWQVPEILMGGNHEQIRRWRREQALKKTRRNRPDLLLGA
jgi:tRNA (guanine37-N1)-methyltransferase